MMILVDQDGPLADFEGRLREKMREVPQAKGFVVEYKDRVNFYVKEDYPEDLWHYVREIMTQPGFFRDLGIVPGARVALLEMIEAGHEVRICTSPLTEYRNCVVEKFDWVSQNLGTEFVRRIIIAKDKTVVRGDYLIDDKPIITGAYSPPLWKQVIYDCPYNRLAKGIRLAGWSNWRQILCGPDGR